MANDFGQEQQIYEVGNKAKAEIDTNNIAVEIGDLDEDEISPDVATFIGGLMLGRELEYRYLEHHFSLEKWPSSAKAEGEKVANLKKILNNAKQGDFNGLKQFVDDEAESWRDLSEDTDEDKQRVDAAKIAERLNLIKDKIPATGSPALIRVPIPAHLEERVPLKIQLESLKQGGDLT